MRVRLRLICGLAWAVVGCGGQQMEQPATDLMTAPASSDGGADGARKSVSGPACGLASPGVIGCGCRQEPTPPPEVWICESCAEPAGASALIGPEGGSLLLRTEDLVAFSLTIPPQALSQPTQIAISESVRAPASFNSASAGYVIEPRALDLLRPASITIRLAAAQPDASMYWSPDTCSEPARLLDSVSAAQGVSGAIVRTGVVFASTGTAPPAQ